MNFIPSKQILTHRFSLIFIAIATLIATILSRGIGLLELPDGFFYYNIGQFLLYNTITAIGPYNATIPQTLYGPVYSVIVAYLLRPTFTRGLVVIPFFQLICIAVSALIVRKLCTILIGKHWRNLSLVIFLLLPFHIVYAMSFMSEALTLFLFTLFALFSVLLLQKRTSLPPSLLVLLACVLVLTKNAYLPLLFIAIIFWLWLPLRDRTHKTGVRLLIEQLPIGIGLAGILFWMNFNHTHYGVWALTNYTGRHLYNNVVHEGKLLPPKDSSIYKTFRSKVSDEQDFYQPEWEVARVFQGDFYEKKLTEIQIDRLFLTFSLEAIKHQPLHYVQNVLRIAWGNATSVPYHTGILTHLGFSDPLCPTCSAQCRLSWNVNVSCHIDWFNPTIMKLFGYVVLLDRSLYPHIMRLVAIFAIVGCIRSFFSRKKEFVFCSLLFLLMFFLQSSAQRIEGRYLLPLYGLYTLFIINTCSFIVEGIQKIKLVLNSRNP